MGAPQTLRLQTGPHARSFIGSSSWPGMQVLYLLIFNLLPAYPLDGGHTLDAILGKLISPVWGQRITGALGLVVSLLLALYAITSLPISIFMLVLAFWMAELNWTMLQNVGGFGRR